MTMTQEQNEALETGGFVNLGKVLEDDTLATIETEYDRLVRFDAQTLGNDEDGRYPYRAMLNFRSEPLKEIILHPAFVGRAIERLGPDIRFWWDQGINKIPGAGSHIDWHQDNGYQRGCVPEYLTFWLALDDSNLDNGGLLVLPGSHRDGQLEHRTEGVHWVIPNINESNAVALDARAGDLLIFSSLLIHKTVGNLTEDRNRRAWVIQYARADAKDAQYGTTYEDRPWVARDGEILEEMYSEKHFDLRKDARNRG